MEDAKRNSGRGEWKEGRKRDLFSYNIETTVLDINICMHLYCYVNAGSMTGVTHTLSALYSG
jgi:hypothetical protein